MKKLGDSHNFGKFVSEINGRIYKPRVIFWEYIFLSELSILRKTIEDYYLKKNLASPFSLAPNLKINFENEKLGHAEKLVLKDLSSLNQIEKHNYSEIGSLIALCFWFGIGDLHKENLKIGLDGNEKLICFPVDIESIFDQMTHVQQTLLIPSDNVSEDKCGLSQLWKRLITTSSENKIELIKGFIDSINLLNSIAHEIFETLLKIPQLDKYYIRVIPRDTLFYSQYIDGEISDELYASEKAQLVRKEIPYFFRIPSEDIINYYSSEDCFESAGFDTSDFNIPSAIKIREGECGKFLKLKTAILSINSIALKLELTTKSDKLGALDILFNTNVFSINEYNDEIYYSTT